MSKYFSQHPVPKQSQSMIFIWVRDQVSHPHKATGNIAVNGISGTIILTRILGK